MEFIKYQHLERFGATEVKQIEIGKCHIFPKIDGSNASVWLNDGELQAGSRKRHLSLDYDNSGFLKWALEQKNIIDYLKENPSHRLFGEWLVPHSLKTYTKDAWNNFYVFDVAIDKKENEILHEGDSKLNYLSYETYQPLLEKHNIKYVPPISIITNSSYEQLVNQLMKNVFLIEEDKGVGEGIVIKNYDFRNKYNRQTFAKIVTSEFKENHINKAEGAEFTSMMIEEKIANNFVTQALCEKNYAKIINDTGEWHNRFIPRLLNTVYYDVVKEECWNFVKKYKNPTINFATLQHFVFAKTKENLPAIFSQFDKEISND